MWPLLPLLGLAASVLFDALAADERKKAEHNRRWLLEQHEQEQRESDRREALAKLAAQFRATAGQARLLELAAAGAAERGLLTAKAGAEAERLLRHHTWWRPMFVPLSRIHEERRTRRTLLETQARCAVQGEAANRDRLQHEAEFRQAMAQLEQLRDEAMKLGGQLALPRGK